MNRPAGKLFSHAAAIFPVENVEASAVFYRDKLGFDIHFTWEDPISYAVVNREDAVGIHLVKKEGEYAPPAQHTALYIFVYDVDEVYREYRAKDIDILQEIGDRAYGMRDFDLRDPNGYILTIGMAIERKS